MEAIHDLLAYDGLKIIQDKNKVSFSIDALLLADFIKPKKETNAIIDLGCGNAPIPLYLSLKTKAKIVGVELQTEIANLAKRSISLNNLTEQIEIINQDCNDLRKEVKYKHYFDIVLSNPPYFANQSHLNKNDYLSLARHELSLRLQDLIATSKYLLKNHGSFYLIHQTKRLEEIIKLLNLEKFKVIKIRFIHAKPFKESRLFLLEAKRVSNKDLVIEKPLFVYDENNHYTEEIINIFNFKNV